MIAIERDKRGRLTGRAIATLTRCLAKAIARAVSAGRAAFGNLAENTRPGDWEEDSDRLHTDILKNGKPSGARVHAVLSEDGCCLESMALLCPDDTYVWTPSPLEAYMLEQPIPKKEDDGIKKTNVIMDMITQGECKIIPENYLFTDTLDMERAVYRLARVFESTAAYALAKSRQRRVDFMYGGKTVAMELDDGVLYLAYDSEGRGYFFAYPLDMQLQACRMALAIAER